ncbi:MAG TPA: glycerol kinase GlpK [Candidatus Binataceae bacterium]|nr:glycerol kinase GlpK [Candidatus Binataceae bacterium]
MRDHVLAIDQGTTGTTVMLLDGHGRIRGRAYGEIRQYYPRPGWVEHDPEEIYRSAVRLSRKAIASAKVDSGAIAAVGITNQRETFVVWERGSGRPLSRAIVWQCRRSAGICEELREREAEITRRTGLLIDPYFSGTKLKWLLDHQKGLRRRAERGEICFGTIECWLIYKLTRGATFVSDFTNASRTMLYNLESHKWDAWMCEQLGVPEAMLPEPVNARGPLGETAPGTIAPRRIMIGAAVGDQQSALFGQGCVRSGDAKVTYGTGAFLLMHTGLSRIGSSNRLITTPALGPDGDQAFALEGSVFIAGAAVQWLRDELRLIAKSSDTEGLARKSRDRTQPYLVPAFVGLGAPYWDSDARGAIVGITRATSKADLVRATLDSIAYQVQDVIGAMEKDTGQKIPELRIDGGAAANDYLAQFQADLLGRPVWRPRMAETTALGAGLLAGIAAGIWRDVDDFTRQRKGGRLFRPGMKRGEREALMTGWRSAVARVSSAKENQPQ